MTHQIRVADPTELPTVAANFRQMWLDIGSAPDTIVPGWRQQTEQFLDDAISDREGRAFVAVEEGEILGSAACQLFDGLYPSIVRSDLRKFGYIWGVYVERSARRRGLANALTRAAVDYLRGLACTRVVLHASPQGRPVYLDLGFESSNELALELGVDS